MKNSRIFRALFFIVLVPALLLGDFGQIFTYQGKLTDASGVPQEAAVDMGFSLWKVESGGTPATDSIWGKAFTGADQIDPVHGLFSVELDVSTGAPASIAWDSYSALWLQVTVDGIALMPREKLTSSFNALNVADDAVNEKKLKMTLHGLGGEDGYLLSFDNATGGFTWIDPASVGGLPGGNDGNVQYKNGTSFAGTDDLHWDATNSRLGIGTASPLYRLHVITAEQWGAGVFINTGSINVSGIYGRANEFDAVGYGGYFEGGKIGAYAGVMPTGASDYYALKGYVNGGTGTNYGVWGSAVGGATNWAGYFEGNVKITGDILLASGVNADAILDEDDMASDDDDALATQQSIKAYVDAQVGSITGDNLGNHTATENLKMSGNWVSNDGGNEGVFVATDGDVGIGTASPGTKLDVSGNTLISGYVGIGGAPAAAPYNVRVYNDTDGAIMLSLRDDDSGVSTGFGSNFIQQRGGSLNLEAWEGHIILKTDSPSTERMRITNGGNVGIGETSPAALLDVNGDILLQSGVNADAILDEDDMASDDDDALATQQSIKAYVDAQVGSITGDNLGNHIATENLQMSGYWVSNDGGSEGVYVATSGDVVIGSGSTSPTADLDIEGNVNLGNDPYTAAGSLNRGYYVYKSGTTAYGIKLHYDGAEYGTMVFGPNQANRFINFGKVGAALEDDDMIEYMRMDLDNGNVGIGTTSPGSKLDIIYDSGDVIGTRITYNTDGGSGNALVLDNNFDRDIGFRFDNRGVTKWTFKNDAPSASTGDDFVIQDQSDNIRFLIQQDGNVGIGTTSPSSKLTVTDNLGSVDGDAVEVSASGGSGSTYPVIYGVNSDANMTSNGTGIGVYGRGHSGAAAIVGTGVWGSAYSTSASSNLKGVIGQIETGSAPAAAAAVYGVVGNVTVPFNGPWAGYFEGDVAITGNLDLSEMGDNILDSDGDAPSSAGDVLAYDGSDYNWQAGGGSLDGSGTTNYVPKWTPDGNTLGNSNIYDDGTEVGIGTTSPSSKLHVEGQVKAINGNAQGYLGVNTTFDAGVYGWTNDASVQAVRAVNTGTNGYAVYALGDRNYFDGNVGIGTNTPEMPLHVIYDDGPSVGTYRADYAMAYFDGVEGRMQIAGSNSGSWGAALYMTTADKTWSIFQPNDASKLFFGYDTQVADDENISAESSQLMTIQSDGNVGIGTTGPLSKLSVGGVGNALNVSSFHGTSNADGSKAIYATQAAPGAAASHTIAIYGNAQLEHIGSSAGYAKGVYGRAVKSDASDGTVGNGRAYGVYGVAGNSTHGYNYGVYGLLTGSINGAAIYGALDGASDEGAGLKNDQYAGYFRGNVGIGGLATAPELRLYEPSGSGVNYTGFKAQAQSANLTYTLPSAYPAASGYVLSSTTAGALSWAAPGGGSDADWNIGSGVIYNTTDNVGIGTTSPSADLEIYKPSGNGAVDMLRLRSKHDTATNVYSLYICPREISYKIENGATGTNLTLSTEAISGGSFSAGYGNIVLSPYGNVGIGVSTPTSDLDVNGTTRLRGHLYDYSNSSGSSGQILTRGASGVVWADGSGDYILNLTGRGTDPQTTAGWRITYNPTAYVGEFDHTDTLTYVMSNPASWPHDVVVYGNVTDIGTVTDGHGQAYRGIVTGDYPSLTGSAGFHGASVSCWDAHGSTSGASGGVTISTLSTNFGSMNATAYGVAGNATGSSLTPSSSSGSDRLVIAGVQAGIGGTINNYTGSAPDTFRVAALWAVDNATGTAPHYAGYFDGDVRVTGKYLDSSGDAGSSGQILSSTGTGTDWISGGGSLPSGTSGQTLRHNGTSWIANSTLYNNGTNVGIGTASPSSKLTVQTTTQPQLTLKYSDTYWLTVSHRGYFNGDATNEYRFERNGTTQMVIQSDGDVGIGTTSPPEKFSLDGTIDTEPINFHMGGTQYIASNAYYSSGWKRSKANRAFAISFDHASDRMSLLSAANGTAGSAVSWINGITLNTSGNVGIGTTSPNAKLQVSGYSNTTTYSNQAGTIYRIASLSDGVGSNVLYIEQNGDIMDIRSGLQDVGVLAFATRTSGANYERMRIANNGNVGIGTTSPSAKLDVVGVLELSGTTPSDPGSDIVRLGDQGTNLRIQTNYGYCDIGPQNSSWSHFYTDRAAFYFGSPVAFNGNVYPYSDNTFDLGTSSNAWRDLYIDGIYTDSDGFGSSGEVLHTDGAGNVYWDTDDAGGGGGAPEDANQRRYSEKGMVCYCGLQNSPGRSFGFEFSPLVDGRITRLGAYHCGSTVASTTITLWLSSSGTSLASITLAGDAGTGWQYKEINASGGISVTAGTNYVVTVCMVNPGFINKGANATWPETFGYINFIRTGYTSSGCGFPTSWNTSVNDYGCPDFTFVPD